MFCFLLNPKILAHKEIHENLHNKLNGESEVNVEQA